MIHKTEGMQLTMKTIMVVLLLPILLIWLEIIQKEVHCYRDIKFLISRLINKKKKKEMILQESTLKE